MKPRNLITLLFLAGHAAAVWPLAAAAQQAAQPFVAAIHGIKYDAATPRWRAFHEGLRLGGYVHNQNVKIEFHLSANAPRSKQVAAEIVARKPNVIFTVGSAISVAVQPTIGTIPMVFTSGGDPVKLGLVASLSQPGRNATGSTRLSHGLAAKQLQLLREAVSNANRVGVLANNNNPNTAQDLAELQQVASQLQVSLVIATADSEQGIAAALDTMQQNNVAGILVGNDPVFVNRRKQILDALARLKLPAIFSFREFADDGGLMSYGASSAETYQMAGAYVARILRGDNPAQLPVQQATRIELVINLKTAKQLDLQLPLSLLGRADEAIE